MQDKHRYHRSHDDCDMNTIEKQKEEIIKCGLKEETQKLKEVSANLAAVKLGEFRNNF